MNEIISIGKTILTCLEVPQLSKTKMQSKKLLNAKKFYNKMIIQCLSKYLWPID